MAAASPVSAKAWQRQPPQSASRRSQLRQGSGIQAVPQGQWEASEALGLSRGRIMRMVVLPQALRVIVPPMTSQYLNLAKNSSLAVAIGYQDIVSIANTTLNQTGREMESMLLMMSIYLAISLIVSAVMNLYNARVRLKER